MSCTLPSTVPHPPAATHTHTAYACLPLTTLHVCAIAGCDQYGYTGMEMLCVEPGTFPIVSVTFFCTFVILSSMMILNLFIGVITTSMQEAKTSLSNEADEEHASTDVSHTPSPCLAVCRCTDFVPPCVCLLSSAHVTTHQGPWQGAWPYLR